MTPTLKEQIKQFISDQRKLRAEATQGEWDVHNRGVYSKHIQYEMYGGNICTLANESAELNGV